ncbi:Replication protein [Chlamydia trachomatis]|nr:Replication protein [Chlamydia trachomatis]
MKKIKSLEKLKMKNNNRKKENLKMLEMRKELKKEINLTFSSENKIKNCSTFIEFLYTEDFEKKKLLKSNSCNNRFCPVCAKNKSVKDAIAMKIISNYVKSLKRAFIFVTLTAPNCKGEDLKEEINKYNDSFKLMFKRKEFKFVKGFVRKLEVTYNQEKDTYHPHFHILISVLPSYFTQTTQYLTRDKWLKNWQEVMNDFSITQVDVRRIKENKNGVDNSILELTKYIAKDSNYLNSVDVFKNFYLGLKGKRMFSYGGDFKIARQLFKNGELEEFYEEDTEEWVYFIKSVWDFVKNKYDNEVIDLRKLSPEEVQELLINNQMSIMNIIKDFE